MEESKPYPVYEFGDFRLDARLRRLTRRNSPEPLAITSRMFDTLLYLIEHRDRLIEKSELLAAVWPNVIVEESNLSTTIYTLRRLLGERPEEHRYIVTVSGRGYRFVASVAAPQAVAPDPDPAAAPAVGDATGGGRRHGTIAALAGAALLAAAAGYFGLRRPAAIPAESVTTITAAVAPDSTSKLTPLAAVALLPFENQTDDRALDQAGATLVRSLSAVLNEAPNLSVVAQRSADAYGATRGDVRAIAHALGATHLVEIAASRSGNDLRIFAQLIDGGAGFQVWSKDFRRSREAFLNNSDDVMLAVASVLDRNAGSTVFVDREAGTRDVEAHVEWLRGLKSLNRFTERDFHDAVLHLENATRRDPDFSLAWLSLAAAHAEMMSFGYEEPSSAARFREASEHARSIRPESKVAHLAYATVAIARGEWEEAERHYLAGSPGDEANGFVSMNVHLQVGRVRDAEQTLRQKRSAAPGDPVVPLNLAIVCGISGKTSESQALADEAVRGGIPDSVLLMHVIRANTAEAAGRYSEAADHMMNVLAPPVRATGGDEAVHLYYEALRRAATRPRAVASLQRLERALDHERYSSYLLRMLLIYWNARLGALDDAFRLADDWVAQYRHSGLVGAPHLAPLWSPELREFRRDPRFARFVAGLKLMDYWKQHGPPDACRLDGEELSCS